MEITTLVERAKQQLAALTGLKPVGVTRIAKENGGWHVAIELLEMSRIPATTDIIGCYEADLDEQGNLQQFVRQRTRVRGTPQEEA